MIRFSRLLVVLLLIVSAAGCAGSSAVQPDDASPPATTASSPADDVSSNPQPVPPEDSSADASEAPAPDTTTAAPELEEAPRDWFHQEATGARVPGMATEQAYRFLDGRTPQRTVTVAIIDSGIDVEHEDLAPHVWVNDDETPGNDVDDDGNGYVDDVNGWNFIGAPNGDQVDADTYELTRLYVELSERFEGADTSSLSPADQEDYARYQEIKQTFEEKRAEVQQQLQNVASADNAVQEASSLLRSTLETDSLSEAAVADFAPTSQQEQRAKSILMYFYQQGVTPDAIKEYHDYLKDQVAYNYNPDFNPRPTVGDDYSDKTERIYGNNLVEGPDASHGTHVAGIVSAVRGNGLGIDGVATQARIMVVRAVPNGDERDKDVANAIRYAADNGADIINMSFGKDYSPEKDVVDAAVRHADSLGVLMVHAAGNDGANIDSTGNFPTRTYLEGSEAQRWIEVGASSWQGGENLAASFSNYGAASVDIFAPGVSIYSTVPDDAYENNDGTSMAAPMVTGLAALLMAYYPDLTALQIRNVILETGTPHAERMVVRPGSPPQNPSEVAFGTLSRTGRIINARAAVQRAAELAR